MDEADGLDVGDFLGGPAGDDVGLIGGGTGDEEVGPGGIGAFKHQHVRAAARGEADVEVVELVGQAILIVDDCEVVLAVQPGGHHVSGFGGAENKYVHAPSAGDAGKRRTDRESPTLALQAENPGRCQCLNHRAFPIRGGIVYPNTSFLRENRGHPFPDARPTPLSSLCPGKKVAKYRCMRIVSKTINGE